MKKQIFTFVAGLLLFACIANAQAPRRGEIDSLKAELAEAADLILLPQQDINALKSAPATPTTVVLDSASLAKAFPQLEKRFDGRYMWMPSISRKDGKPTAVQAIIAHMDSLASTQP